MQTKPLIASLALMFAPSLGAQQAPHEHGVAELRVAVDGATVVIEFESPLDNLVGFEHAPRNAGQRDALAAAEARLKGFDGLFVLDAAAACVLADVQLESPYPGVADVHDHHGHGHEHHEHEHHDHEHHGHEHRGHDHHGHAHGAHDEARAHADMYVAYQLECAHPGALRELGVGLFEAFPRLHTLRAQTATRQGQEARRLDKANTGLPL